MSMVKPIGVSMSAFDATQSQVFSFTSNGGNQVVKNELTIRLNSTNEIVYQNTEERYALNQNLPKNILTNGNYYNFTFITYDVNENASEESSPISFYCYSMPTISFTNLTENQIILSASYEFIALYSQKQGELIDFLKFYLYDANNDLVSESDNLYSTENPPNKFTFNFTALGNNKSYKIKAKAITLNGQISETEEINFSVKYVNPILYNNILVENNCNEGYNQIVSNLLLVDGIANPKDVDYVDDDTKVNIINYGDYVKWQQGFKIDKGFIFEIWFGCGSIGKQFKLINKENDKNYFIGNWIREIPYGETEPKDYIEVIGYINNVENFYMRSNYVDLVNNTSDLTLWFKFDPINSDYELILNVENQVDSVLNWNEDSNVEYGRNSTISYKSPQYSAYDYKLADDVISNELNLTNLEDYVLWNSLIIDKDFCLKIFMTPSIYFKSFLYLSNKNGDKLSFRFIREIPLKEENPKDCIEISYSDKIKVRSNYVDILNNTSKLVLFVKKVGDEWSVILNVISQEDNTLVWNKQTNVKYNMVTDIQYKNEVCKRGKEFTPIINNIDEIFPLSNANISNGVYENLTITKDTDIEFDTNILPFNEKTIIQCLLENNLNGKINEDYNCAMKIGNKKDNLYGDVNEIIPITKVEIYNGIYDNIDITGKIIKDFSTDKPIWDYCTFLNCDFNGNINGGNVNIVLSQLSSIRIKCREYGTYNWITLFERDINTQEDLNISTQDYRVPSGTKVEYAIVPVLNGNIEGDYIAQDIEVVWRKLFVSDIDDTLSLESNISYGDTVRNSDIAYSQPINSKYPIFIQNGNLNYESGSISGNVLNNNLINGINRNEIVKLNNRWKTFLTNGKTKIIKDWNGNIWLARISNSPSNNYIQSIGNGFGQISFTWIEQGKWDNQEDLYKNNLIKE